MFHGWGEFYLLAGSAAAVLAGLLFVVITLLQDRSRSSVLKGSRLYMGPILLHVSFVLALSGAALAPEITERQFAIVAGVVAAWGLFRGLQSIAGIGALTGEDTPHWTDVWFYGIIPTALFALLAFVAAAFWGGADWAKMGLAAMITMILLVSIRNEWDLITWIAPKPDALAPDAES